MESPRTGRLYVDPSKSIHSLGEFSTHVQHPYEVRRYKAAIDATMSPTLMLPPTSTGSDETTPAW